MCCESVSVIGNSLDCLFCTPWYANYSSKPPVSHCQPLSVPPVDTTAMEQSTSTHLARNQHLAPAHQQHLIGHLGMHWLHVPQAKAWHPLPLPGQPPNTTTGATITAKQLHLHLHHKHKQPPSPSPPNTNTRPQRRRRLRVRFSSTRPVAWAITTLSRLHNISNTTLSSARRVKNRNNTSISASDTKQLLDFDLADYTDTCDATVRSLMAGDDDLEGHPPRSPAPAPAPAPEHRESHTPDLSNDSIQPSSTSPPASPPPPEDYRQSQQQPDSSLVETTTLEINGQEELDSFTEEQRLHAHLTDVESSFLPPISPIHVATRPEEAVDDTFLFDVSPTKRALPAPPLEPIMEQDSTLDFSEHHEPRDHDASQSTHGGAAADESLLEPLPAYENEMDQSDFETRSMGASQQASQRHPTPSEGDASLMDNTASLEAMSSPTAAAAARTMQKSTSMATTTNAEEEAAQESTEEPSGLEDSSVVITRPEETTRPRLAQRYSSDLDANRSSTDAGATPGNALKSGKRPRFLRTRNTSQISTTSSGMGVDEVEDESTGPIEGELGPSSSSVNSRGPMPRSMSNTLSRTISLGSMASGIDDYAENSRDGYLEPPQEEDEEDHPDHDPLSTPRASKLVEPTDTVLARKVLSVQVPDSIAREYKTKGGFATPFRSTRNLSDSTPSVAGTTTRGGKNLTLKEQSSTIERLSKENFDLKLKVMFLSDRLDKMSPEGVKEALQENTELKTSLGIIQRDNKVLRRRVKELERRLKDEQDRPSTARSSHSSEGGTAMNDEQAREREEELIYLRERVEEYVTEIEHLRNESMADQADKRKLAETLKSYRDYTGERSHEHLGKDEEVAVWKDLFEQESVRREQVDEDNRKLREELFRIKQGATGSSTAPGALHHTTNIYNITRKGRPTSPTRSRPGTGHSGDVERTNSFSQADTVIEDYRRENEQLRHEIGELRREVGAQTSMLTSRNREKERLYQEIEDLKLSQRRGGTASSTLDSLLDRSASRAGVHERSMSRASAGTRLTVTEEDPDREELENKLAESRDKVNELKLLNQQLQRDTQSTLEAMETLRAEAMQLSQEHDVLLEDHEEACQTSHALQQERNDALTELNAAEYELEQLRAEAQEMVDNLETQNEQYEVELQRLEVEVQERSDNFTALQEEMRHLSEALAALEDEQENKLKNIQRLEAELGDANRELEELEVKLVESNDKAQRLGVQQESSQDEIAFLREEQEGDKIRIGDLEASLAMVEQELREERDRAKELDQRLVKERKQRELVADREKEEVQQFVNELNREASSAKDEVRKLRKSLSSREVEATEWKERLMELESNLREALGDLNGTRSSLLKVSPSDREVSLLSANKVNSLSQSCSASLRTRCGNSTRPKRLPSKRTGPSTSAIASSRVTVSRCASLARCLTRRDKRIATPRTITRPSSGRTRTYQGRSRHKTHASTSSREAVMRTRSGSPSSSHSSRTS